ncbi:MAG TPA: LacI family transcriptional regulator [Clostridiales bacterium]|nr:LacI family transcriptional regulator [Clostridiales bacterium]
MKDIAKYTGLSIATVSKYINGGNVLEKNKVLLDEAIKVLDFKINEMARGLKTNRSMTVGIMIPSLENIFFTSIISNVENILLQNGYSSIICDYREDPHLEREKLDFLLSRKVDGIIMVPHSNNAAFIQSVVEKGIPVVFIDRYLEDVQCDVVLVDNINASYNAVEQLIIRGHKRIGIICGPSNIYTTKERLKGYVRAHEDYAVKVDNDLVQYGKYDVESGYHMLIHLLKMENPPTAVYVTNYEMTLGAIMAINEKGIKVPDQMSLIGFDNIQLAKIVKPSLSIVVQPMKEIGEKAAQVLLSRLNKENTGGPSISRLKTELLIRESIKSVQA